MAAKPSPQDLLYDGLWALFFITCAAAALLVLAKAGVLLRLAEDFQADSYDTMLSVKAFSEYGPLGELPFFTQPQRLYGSFPLLYAMLAGAINLAINDVPVSTALLYWLVEICIAWLLWGKVLKRCDWRVRAAFIALFLVDIAFGNLFPLGFRKRQQLAILIGMAMFLPSLRFAQIVLAFCAMLAQPFTGAALILLKAADSVQKKDWGGAMMLAAALGLSLPFYSGLLSASMLEPAMAGCGAITYQAAAGPMLLLSLAFLTFFLSNRGKTNLLSAASLGLALYFPLALGGYLLVKDALPADLASRLLFLSSMPCNESLLQAAAIGMAVLIGHQGFRAPRLTVSLLLVASVISMSALSAYLYTEHSQRPAYEGALSSLQGMGAERVKTIEVVFTEQASRMRSVTLFPFFHLQSFSILNGYNVTFVDESSLPPQLSRGGSNIPMSRLPLEIYSGDVPACRADTASIKSAGAEALLITVDFDFTTGQHARPERFTDPAVLSACGLELESRASDADGSITLLYKVS